PVLEALFADKGLISRDMAENMLRAKRLDGAQAALDAINAANFGGGQQAEVLAGRLGELRVPLQVLWGEKDEVIPARQADGLPQDIHVTILPGAGHMPQMEKAAEVNRAILVFVER
ncbi:MAG: alpha/beta fold hydrolase, partial [Acetobacteraceae bacterium]|nr:alpha/beta fold hydrolase [Acetobacteraceae bacterium]